MEDNPHIVGTLMKEAVRRAIVAIRARRFRFEVEVKGQTPRGMDLVTTVDRLAQRVYIKLLREWFPEHGIVAEEEQLSVPCRRTDCDTWFTVDPLDGTKAFVRRQSHGIGTMVSLVRDGVVEAAVIGDVMTQEVYATRPGSDRVYRISEFGVAEQLEVPEHRPLARQSLLLRQPSSPLATWLRDRGAFGYFQTASGSVGLAKARLWKGEVGGSLLRSGWQAPWDLLPVVGLSEPLGFVFLAFDGETLTPIQVETSRQPIAFEHEVLVVHQQHLSELGL